MKDFKDINLLQDYHHGRLSAADKADFEQKLSENGDLAAEWKAYQTIVKGLEADEQAAKEIAALQQQLEAEGFFDAVHAEIKQQNISVATTPPAMTPAPSMSVRRSTRMWQWAAAASMALLAAALWFLNQGEKVSDVLYAQMTQHGGMAYGYNSENDTLFQAHEQLKQHNPDRALQLLQSMRPPLSDNAKYLFAWAWYEKNNWDNCLKQLHELYNDGHGAQSIHPDILWDAQLLEAAALDRKGQKAEAVALLENFIQYENQLPEKERFNQAARKLLREIK